MFLSHLKTHAFQLSEFPASSTPLVLTSAFATYGRVLYLSLNLEVGHVVLDIGAWTAVSSKNVTETSVFLSFFTQDHEITKTFYALGRQPCCTVFYFVYMDVFLYLSVCIFIYT